MRRAVGRLPLFFAIGAAISVAVAWFLALFGNVRGWDFRDPPRPDDRLLCGLRVPAGWDCRTWLVERGFGVDYEVASEMMWMGSAFGMTMGEGPKRSIERVSLGWPRPCLVFATDLDHFAANTPEVRRWLLKGIHLPGQRKFARNIPRRLPLMPLWTGLATDSLVFGAVAWGSWRAAGSARAWSRRRRGLCPHCAYEVVSSGICPECGNPVRLTREGPG